jgi:hypothetical protein
MPDIPEEILDKIIGCATAANDGFSERASFVSHTFHRIVLPHKFRSLIFKFYRNGAFFFPYKARTGTGTIEIPKFCEAINAGDAHAFSLAPLVQELRLQYWRYSDLLMPFEKIMSSVLSFQNLAKLSVEKCDFSPAIMKQLDKLVQLQSLHTWRCNDVRTREGGNYCDVEPGPWGKASHGALSNLQSLHTLECDDNGTFFRRHLACIPMKNLRILKSSEMEVTWALLTTDPPVQLKELWLTCRFYGDGNFSVLWNYLARMTSLTHLSLQHLELSDGPPPSLVFSFQNLQYLHIHVALAPRFADQPMKKLEIDTETKHEDGKAMEEVRQHWQGIVFPHVEYLETDRPLYELEEIPIEFWREFLLNVNEVG